MNNKRNAIKLNTIYNQEKRKKKRNNGKVKIDMK